MHSSGLGKNDQLMEQQEQCVSLGKFLAGRLVEIGVTHCFGVPGDFNLALLDELGSKEGLKMIWTCNELNAGYAADGFCRRKGVGACVVTYGVGGYSLINAAAGCFSEDLPVIFICGGPNSNDFAANHIIHHTVGLPDLKQQYRTFKEVTCAAVVIQHLSEAHHQIDFAISQALKLQKPAYIEVCCNLAGLEDPSFTDPPIQLALPASHTNQASLRAAVAETVKQLEAARKPVLLGGPRIRAGGRRTAFRALAEALQGAVATTADAKSLFPEDHQQHIGYYLGSISSPCTCEIVESADLVVAVGCVWTDYSTLGYSLLLKPAKMICVDVDRVTVKGGKTFGCIDCEEFLHTLAAEAPARPAALTNFKRMLLPPASAADVPDLRSHTQAKTALQLLPATSPAQEEVEAGGGTSLAPETGGSCSQDSSCSAQPACRPGGDGDCSTTTSSGRPLTTNGFYRQIQAMLTPEMCLLAETGDSWFDTLKLRLPAESDYVIQMRYGSIGWSVGATLGYSLAAAAEGKRLVSFIGDGSFQVTAQDISTMMRFHANPIIFLINNAGYAIEIEIHDGPYNRIQNWDYVGLVQCMRHHKFKDPKVMKARSEIADHAGDSSGSRQPALALEGGAEDNKLFAVRVATEEQLAEALRLAVSDDKRDCLVFIEVLLDTDDVSKELLEFGARVAEANSRKPSPQ